MPISLRDPEKRGRTLYAIPYLMAYKREDEKLDNLRLGLDTRSRELLHRLANADNLADSTWLSMLAHRLLTEPELIPAIERFANRRYRIPSGPQHPGFKMYTIPRALKQAIERTSKTFPTIFEKKDRLVSKWVRMALVYCASEEKGWTVDAAMLHPEPSPVPEPRTKATAIKGLLYTAQTPGTESVPCPMPKGFYEQLQQAAPSLFGQTGEEVLRRYISRGLREDLLNLEMTGSDHS